MSHVKAFTLAEVLITLAIIGVVAAITIPSVIVNTNQMEFKTGLRKAVSVLNQAITMNKALTGESPYDNSDLFNYLQQYMSITQRALMEYYAPNIYFNTAFYTTDGFRYEVPTYTGGNTYSSDLKLHESDVYLKIASKSNQTVGGCGSLGLTHNPDSTTEPPCLIMVDVNGDRKPNPVSVSHPESDTLISNAYFGYIRWMVSGSPKYADPNGRLLTDVFSIMITDQGAIPYGVVAQKAMYQAQK